MGQNNKGFSETGLRRMREVLARHVESGKIPGLVALVSRGGETHVEAIGTMRHDGGAPMRRDTIFRMASTSKPVSIAAAMVLLDECRLRLDDPVDTWLPELADRQVLKRIDGPLDDTVPARRPITVRDVLTSTFGLGMDMTLLGTPIMNAVFEQGLTPNAGADARAGRVDAPPRHASADATSPASAGSTRSATTCSACSSPGSPASRSRRSCANASSIRWA